jgi:hypothetical protein
MTLAFLNPTRSFDHVRHAVSFFGHDGVFEIRFFVEASALARPGPAPTGSDAPEKCLSAFDALRASIHEAARQAYASRRGSSYTLTAADFR